MNTLVPEPEIPSHQGPDAQSVDRDLDVVTMAVKVPETLAHLHHAGDDVLVSASLRPLRGRLSANTGVVRQFSAGDCTARRADG